MNERIIEMAIAAGFNPVNCTGGNVPLFEKFAELIVRECADQFKLVYTDEQYQRRIDKTILKHFGFYE